MSIRSCFVIFLVGYVITSVASVPICPIHGLSTCPCSNTIFSPTCGSGGGNVCSQCRGYPMSPPSKAYYNKPSPHDMYSCSTVVRPAFVPETCPCNCHETPILDKDSYEESDSPNKQHEQHNPVDPVSLTLAQKLLDQPKRRIPESKIWFCPKKAVLNDIPKKVRKNIPEERLFAMERDVIELKPSKSKWGYWDDDSANESDNSDSSSEKANSGSSESNEVSDEVKHTEVTYKKIGYDHIKVNDAKREKNAIKLLPPITLDDRWAIEDRIYKDRHDIQSLPFVPGEVTIRKRKIKQSGNANSVEESYEDLSNRFQSIVKNSQIKLFRNVLNPLGFNPFIKLSGNLCL